MSIKSSIVEQRDNDGVFEESSLDYEEAVRGLHRPQGRLYSVLCSRSQASIKGRLFEDSIGLRESSFEERIIGREYQEMFI